jgi:mRNA-degrading endonuclease HigB of HigAB toxin-antitoxin module
MEKGRYKYFAVIQNPERANFRRAFVYVNKREWTDPSGIYQAATCRSITPNANGHYVIDIEGDYAKEKLAVLNRAVNSGKHPIIGPFDSVEEAIVAERKSRPLTDKEKLAQADANANELAILRKESEELKARLAAKQNKKE